MKVCAPSNSVRRSRLSASAPEIRAKIMIGSAFDACTSAISVAESVSCVIIQAAPTDCTSPPKFEISVADHSRRKSAWRNGANGLLRGGGLITSGPGS